MNPETQRLTSTPRDNSTDAFFFEDRSGTTARRTADHMEVAAQGRESQLAYETGLVKGQRDRQGVSAVAETFTVFTNKHSVIVVETPNPLPHARKVDPKATGLDSSLTGWTHNARYRVFFNAAARALSGREGEPRLQVRLLFGTGSEYYRHGVCGAVENAATPILLIVVRGIEPQYTIDFFDPANPSRTRPLLANNRWGVGITTAAIISIINQRYARPPAYDLSLCGAFSTGYLGLQGSINNSLFSISQLTRVVIFDCLYAELKGALDRVKAATPAAHIIAYVVTSGGNSFQPNTTASLATLSLGGNAAWNYVDLIGNVGFHAITSARLINEARRSDARILDPLLSAHEAALNGLVAALPARNTVVSNEGLIRKVKGSVPSSATPLAKFASDKTNASLIRNFFAQIGATRRCIGRARLLGWATPPGEEWHDMLLIEFAWEYLT
jgi:hypothetical protein